MSERLPSSHAPAPAPAAATSRLRVSQGLVGALCLALTTLVALSLLIRFALSSWMWWTAVLAVAALWWVLRRRTRSVAEQFANSLDERDLATRNSAAWWGFSAAIIAGNLAALALVIAARLDTLSSQDVLDRSGASLLALMIAAGAVPTMVLAATDRTTENLDEDDESP